MPTISIRERGSRAGTSGGPVVCFDGQEFPFVLPPPRRTFAPPPDPAQPPRRGFSADDPHAPAVRRALVGEEAHRGS